jgi:hypothetical protein
VEIHHKDYGDSEIYVVWLQMQMFSQTPVAAFSSEAEAQVFLAKMNNLNTRPPQFDEYGYYEGDHYYIDKMTVFESADDVVVEYEGEDDQSVQ